MTESANVALVRRLYESGMAPEVVAEIMSPQVVWDIAPGFPFGGVYEGWPDVAAHFLGRLAALFTSFGAVPSGFYGDGDRVFVLGHYHAVIASGAEGDAKFVHVWTVVDGQLTHLDQTADSHALRDLLLVLLP